MIKHSVRLVRVINARANCTYKIARKRPRLSNTVEHIAGDLLDAIVPDRRPVGPPNSVNHFIGIKELGRKCDVKPTPVHCCK